jgi:fatty-acyl-CoA synthase
MIQGLMQSRPLLVSSLIEHAARYSPHAEIVSRTVEGPIHRCTYADIERRAKQLANALTALGVQASDRIATIAWNGYRHMELYYGVSGMGAVLHTINPRLPADQLEFVIRHADDQYVFFDATFAPLVEKVAPKLSGVKGWVALSDRAHTPACSIPGLLHYEELIAEYPPQFDWPQFDENTAAALCYTSGTTGNPKGVLYSHRSTVLHALASCSADGLAYASSECALVIVPMFHVNAWGAPYSGAMSGAKLVMPGPALDGRSVYELMKNEGVTLAFGVPTVWLALFAHVDAEKLEPRRDLKLRRVVIGGSAAPRAMCERFTRDFGAYAIHAWGMTEMSPIGTICNLLPKHATCSPEQVLDVQARQGRPSYGVELRITDDEGHVLPHDGTASGNLKVRGPWIASAYFGEPEGSALDADGFFPTGDIAKIDADGYMQITDRTKDIIKSGGEWISSIALENAAVGHPAVAEAAVIGVPHPKWQERPLMVVVRKPGAAVSREELLAWLEPRIAKWWLPDDVAFVDSLPHGATGKLQKAKLREQFRDYQLP